MKKIDKILLSRLGDIRLIIKNEYLNGDASRKFDCVFGDGSIEIFGDITRCQGCEDEIINFKEYDELCELIDNCMPCLYSHKLKKVFLIDPFENNYCRSLTIEMNKELKFGLLEDMCTETPIDCEFDYNKPNVNDFRVSFINRNEFRQTFGDNYKDKKYSEIKLDYKKGYSKLDKSLIDDDVIQLVKQEYQYLLQEGNKVETDGSIRFRENMYIFGDGTFCRKSKSSNTGTNFTPKKKKRKK